MAVDLERSNEMLLEFARLVEGKRHNAWEGRLKTGVDLGTANIVLSVVDERNRPHRIPPLWCGTELW